MGWGKWRFKSCGPSNGSLWYLRNVQISWVIKDKQNNKYKTANLWYFAHKIIQEYGDSLNQETKVSRFYSGNFSGCRPYRRKTHFILRPKRTKRTSRFETSARRVASLDPLPPLADRRPLFTSFSLKRWHILIHSHQSLSRTVEAGTLPALQQGN